MSNPVCKKCGHSMTVEVFAAYITRNGKVIYPNNAKVFHFFVCECSR
jgi:hypothetical protein